MVAGPCVAVENTKVCSVFSMMSDRPVVAYVYARVQSLLPLKAALERSAWLRGQVKQIQHWADTHGFTVVRWFFRMSTYSGTAFPRTAEFSQALAAARDAGSALVLADIRELLSRTARDKIERSIIDLDTAGVEILDASRNKAWRSLTKTNRFVSRQQIMAANLARSRPAKNAITERGRSFAARTTENWRRGNAANRVRADRHAQQHASFVLAEKSKLPAGVPLSPTALARSMNEAGLLTSRFRPWSHNAAKNLIQRLQRLQLL